MIAFPVSCESMTMQNQLFEAALGIAEPWYVQGVDFDAARKALAIRIDFVAGSRFAYPGVEGAHPVHDTQIKRQGDAPGDGRGALPARGRDAGFSRDPARAAHGDGIPALAGAEGVS